MIKKELKKYSYIPTPDHKYLIELSINVGEEYPSMRNLNVLYLTQNLKKEYPFVEDIRVYKYNKDKENSRLLETSQEITLKDSDLKLKKDKNQDEHIKRALQTDEVQEQIIKDEGGNSYTFKYIPYTTNDVEQEEQLGWWSSYVIEVLYNDQALVNKISHQRDLFVRSKILMSILYFAFIFIIFYFIAAITLFICSVRYKSSSSVTTYS